MSTPSDVTKLLQDALDTQPTIVGQPNDDDLLSLKEKLLDVLQTVTYDRADGVHHVVGVLQAEAAYMADHSGDAFPIPQRLGLWDDKIDKNATVVELKKAEAMHKARADDYGIWKAAEDGCKKLIRAAVEEVYINELKDGTTFFHKVNARDLLEHLEKNSTGLHALDIVALRTNMLLLYKNAASMPDFILTMEEAQKKAKRAELPILDIELAMYAATSVLQSGDYKKETDEWEGRHASIKTWTEWKQAYLAAYARGVNRQRAGATDEPFTRAANNIMPAAPPDVMDALAGSLDNLALAATSDKTALQQLTTANLALTTTVSTLTIANKKLTETIARFNLPPNLRGGHAGRGGANKPKAVWGNYCWTHGYKTSHSSATCAAAHRLPGHDASATVADTKGGKEFNKDWYLQGNKDT
jgi:hypothetical protein